MSTWLAADRIVAVVPAKLASRVRMLSTGHGRKSDDADATSVGIAALAASSLQTWPSTRPSSSSEHWSSIATAAS